MQAEFASKAVETSDFQALVLALPQVLDLFLGGGRGGGKSYALALLALRHVTEYAERARINHQPLALPWITV